MRNLCTIQTIKRLEDIPGKDKIKLASFQSTGWKVIVSADMFVDQKVVYCEADTLLPVRPEFEFLRLRCYSEKWDGFRIRNMKMAGVYSEGIVFPLDVIAAAVAKEAGALVDGLDVTSQMGARKYDPEALEESALLSSARTPWWKQQLCRVPLFKKMLLTNRAPRRFPKEIISISDETRLQSLQYVFDNPPDAVTITEKIDGQSATYIWEPRKRRFTVCSRKLVLSRPDDSNYWKIARKYDMKKSLQVLYKSIRHVVANVSGPIAVQGEIVGPGIQGNKYKLKELQFRVYTIKVGDQHINPLQIRYALETAGLKLVPVIESCCGLPFTNMEEALEYSKGYSMLPADGELVFREGVVVRSAYPRPAERGMSGQYSFKIINPDFAIEYGL